MLTSDRTRDNIPYSRHLTWTIHLFNTSNNGIVRHIELHSFMYLVNHRLVWLCTAFSPSDFSFQLLSLVNFNEACLEDML